MQHRGFIHVEISADDPGNQLALWEAPPRS